MPRCAAKPTATSSIDSLDAPIRSPGGNTHLCLPPSPCPPTASEARHPLNPVKTSPATYTGAARGSERRAESAVCSSPVDLILDPPPPHPSGGSWQAGSRALGGGAVECHPHAPHRVCAQSVSVTPDASPRHPPSGTRQFSDSPLRPGGESQTRGDEGHTAGQAATHRRSDPFWGSHSVRTDSSAGATRF